MVTAAALGCDHGKALEEADQGTDIGGATAALPVVKKHAIAELRFKIGRYGIPQDGGRLDVAAPTGWELATPRKKDYLVGFHPRRGLEAGEVPLPDLQVVDETRIVEFVRAVSQSLAGKKLREPVTPVMVGEQACAAYVEGAQLKTPGAVRLVVKTVSGGRLYSVHLELPESEFDRFRDAAYAVIASMKVKGSADTLPATKPTSDAEEKKPPE